MVNQIKYYLAALFTIPFLPVLYFQGKKIKKSVPKLPEAIGTEGVVGHANQQINLLTLGESTIAGVGVDQHKNGFTGALATQLSEQHHSQINWKVVAKSGYNADQVAKKLISQIGDFKPDLIVVGLGGNDAFELNSPKKWRADMKSILKNLTTIFPDVKIVCTNMPPIKEFPAFTPIIKSIVGNLVELLGNELKDLVKGFDNIYYLDEKLTLKDWSNKFDKNLTAQDFFSDGVHPSPLTYQTWGREVGKYIFEEKIIFNFST